MRMSQRITLFATIVSIVLGTFAAEAATKTWTGSVSTDWGTSGNWSPTGVPASGDDPTIPTGLVNYPLIATSSFTVRGLSLAAGATISQSGGTLSVRDFIVASGGSYTQTGGTLLIRRDWRNSGTFTSSNGTVEFAGNGSAPNFASGTNQYFNVKVDAGVDPIFGQVAGASLLIAGDFTNNNTGLNISNNPTFTFNGSGNQSVTSASTSGNVTFGNLVINKASGTVTLASTINISGTLSLNGGNVLTGSNTLIVGRSATSTGGVTQTSGIILGTFQRWISASVANNILFPVGAVSSDRSANVSFTTAPTTGGTLTVTFTVSNPGTSGLPLSDAGTSIVNCAPEGFWTVTSGNGLAGGKYLLDLTAQGFSGISNVATLRILKRANSSSAWTLDGTHVMGTGTPAIPVAHRSGMTGFAQFGIGAAADNPLPITLASLLAAWINPSDVQVTWTTVTEVNNYGFEVQRAAALGGSFQTIPGSFVAGKGTTLNPQKYSFIDATVGAGEWYYRLKQMDLDGTVHYSDGVMATLLTGVQKGEGPLEYSLSQNYPNPFNPSTTIRFAIPRSGHVTLKVYNILGSEVTTLVEGERMAGGYSVVWNAISVASGTYFYRLEVKDSASGKGFVQTKKFQLLK